MSTERSKRGLSMSHDGSAYSSRRLTSSQRSRPLDSAEHLPVRTKLKPPRSLAPWRSMSILPCASCCAGGILSFVVFVGPGVPDQKPTSSPRAMLDGATRNVDDPAARRLAVPVRHHRCLPASPAPCAMAHPSRIGFCRLRWSACSTNSPAPTMAITHCSGQGCCSLIDAINPGLVGKLSQIFWRLCGRRTTTSACFCSSTGSTNGIMRQPRIPHSAFYKHLQSGIRSRQL